MDTSRWRRYCATSGNFRSWILLALGVDKMVTALLLEIYRSERMLCQSIDTRYAVTSKFHTYILRSWPRCYRLLLHEVTVTHEVTAGPHRV